MMRKYSNWADWVIPVIFVLALVFASGVLSGCSITPYNGADLARQEASKGLDEAEVALRNMREQYQKRLGRISVTYICTGMPLSDLLRMSGGDPNALISTIAMCQQLGYPVINIPGAPAPPPAFGSFAQE